MAITVITLSRRQHAILVITSRSADSDTEQSQCSSSRFTEGFLSLPFHRHNNGYWLNWTYCSHQDIHIHTYIKSYILTHMQIYTYANFNMVGKRMLNTNNSLLSLFYNRCGNIAMANTPSHISHPGVSPRKGCWIQIIHCYRYFITDAETAMANTPSHISHPGVSPRILNCSQRS